MVCSSMGWMHDPNVNSVFLHKIVARSVTVLRHG